MDTPTTATTVTTDSGSRVTGTARAATSSESVEVQGPPFADCVQCGEPTEYAASVRGATLCPVCEWQEGERIACANC